MIYNQIIKVIYICFYNYKKNTHSMYFHNFLNKTIEIFLVKSTCIFSQFMSTHYYS